MPSILQVALDTPLYRFFDYRLPDDLGEVLPGTLVEVPLGAPNRLAWRSAYVSWSCSKHAKFFDGI